MLENIATNRENFYLIQKGVEFRCEEPNFVTSGKYPPTCDYYFATNKAFSSGKFLLSFSTDSEIQISHISVYITNNTIENSTLKINDKMNITWNITYINQYSKYVYSTNFPTKKDYSTVITFENLLKKISFSIIYEEEEVEIETDDILEIEDIRNSAIAQMDIEEDTKEEIKKDEKQEEENAEKKFIILCLYGAILSSIDLVVLLVLIFLLLYFKKKIKNIN